MSWFNRKRRFTMRPIHANEDGAGITDLDSMVDFLDDEAGGGGDGGASDSSEGAGEDAGGAESGAAAGDDGAGGGDGAAEDPANQSGAGDGEGAAASQSGDGSGEDGAGGADGDGGGAGETVPTLLQERASHKEELANVNRKLGRYEHLQEQVNQVLANRQQGEGAAEEDDGGVADEELPNYLDDPKAYIDGMFTRLEALITKGQQQTTNIEQRENQRMQMQEINTALTRFDAGFRNEHADYDQAVEHLRKFNVDNLTAMGMPEEQAAKQAVQAVYMTQVQAMQARQDPAAYLYGLAQRTGYKPAAANDGGAGDGKGDGQGAGDNDQGGEGQSKEDLEAKLKGQDAGSLGAGGAVNVDELANIESDDEFEGLMDEIFKEQGYSR